MKKYIFEEGQKFGKLLITGVAQEWRTKKNGHKASKPVNIITCLCDCGSIVTFQQECFHGKRTCGCVYGNSRYGIYNKRLYTTWRSMKSRCFWEECPNYFNYGGRGITVCEGMLDFNKYQLIVGEPPSKKHSVDRIDNNGNYSCGECNQCKQNKWGKNVRWATPKEQGSNKRNNHMVKVDGIIVTLKEACRIKGLPYKQVHERVKRGKWDIEIAINTPVIKGTNIRYKKLINDKISTN